MPPATTALPTVTFSVQPRSAAASSLAVQDALEAALVSWLQPLQANLPPPLCLAPGCNVAVRSTCQSESSLDTPSAKSLITMHAAQASVAVNADDLMYRVTVVLPPSEQDAVAAPSQVTAAALASNLTSTPSRVLQAFVAAYGAVTVSSVTLQVTSRLTCSILAQQQKKAENMQL